MSRRHVVAAAGAMLCTGARAAAARQAPLPLEVAIRLPWMANQVALTGDGTLFLGLPRYASDKPTPSLARRGQDGSLAPFPDNSWNQWVPGGDGREAFVYLNSVHMFADDTVWCVDQGALSPGVFGAAYAMPQAGAQKLVQLDPRTGAVGRILRFDDTILPPGAQMNDLRRHGSLLYITDSGLGGIIVHDLDKGRTLRRLSGNRLVKASAGRIPAILAHIQGGAAFRPPNSDMIEVSADGRWLYWASPTGPFRRVATRYLNDPAMSDAELARHVEPVFASRFAGGCAMDTQGNLYLSETASGRISVRSPSGRMATLAADPTLIGPDGSFISRDLYIPVKTPLPATSHDAEPDRPFVVYALRLPARFDGIRLGNAITGD